MSKSLDKIISDYKSRLHGFNPPASSNDLLRLKKQIPGFPEVIEKLYRDHNGSNQSLRGEGMRLQARLMPIVEVLEMQPIADTFLGAGKSIWLWTDDNSNYVGIYADELLKNHLFIVDHEEPILTPAYRSIESFMSRLLIDSENDEACDISSLSREFPKTSPDPLAEQEYRELAAAFQNRFRAEIDEDLRRLFAFITICLTPYENTPSILPFLNEKDIWIPEAAVRLLEIRRWRENAREIEDLARDGKPNGDRVAMRLLVRMNTPQSHQAIERLRKTLQGQKLQMLESWLNATLPPPPWL